MILALLVIASVSLAVLAVLLPAVSADTDGTVITNASVNPVGIRIGDTTTVTLKVKCDTTMEHSPVDVVLVTDRSGSMRQSGWLLVKEGDPAYTFNDVSVPKEDWSVVKTFTVGSDVDKLAAQVTWDRVPGYNGSEASELVINLWKPDGYWIFNGDYYSLPSEPNAGEKVDPPDSVGKSNEYYSGICTKPQTLLVENPGAGTWKVAVYGWNLRPKTDPPSAIDVDISVYMDDADTPGDNLSKTDTSISIEAAMDAAKSFIGNMNASDRAGYVKFGSYGKLAHGLTDMDDTGKSSINSTIDWTGLEGGTAINTGIDKAKSELVYRGRDDVPRVIVLLTDGQNDNGPAPVLQSAQAAKDEGITIFTIGLTKFVNEEMLKEVATKPDYYYHAPTGAQLQEIYNEISERIAAMASSTQAHYVLPDDVEYAGNATREPDNITGNTLMWGIGDCACETWTVSFDVRPLTTGYDIRVMDPDDSNVTYEMEGESKSEPFIPEELFVDVGAFSAQDFSITPCPEGRYIGDSVGINGSVVVSNTVSKANVTVKLYVDYPTMGHAMDNKTYTVDADTDTTSPPINVSGTWIPMSSGRHTISIYVYELKDDGTEFWMDAQGPNSGNETVYIYIKRVIS